jgi:flavodoxin
MPARKRTLIVYYSLSGNTERVARDLAAHLDADLRRLRERTNRHGFLGHLRAAFDSLSAAARRSGFIRAAW